MDTVKPDPQMPEGHPCPQCGTPLQPGALAGLCPACLLRQGATEDSATEGGARPFVPPTPNELAPLFPQLEIVELIGKGGMGAVYQARQRQLGRIVALKILPPDIGDAPAFAERFAREARALAQLNHPGIVTLYEFGKVDYCRGREAGPPLPALSPSDGERVAEGPVRGSAMSGGSLYFFLMEFVDGVNLRQLLRAGRLSPREALAIVPQICDALQFAHDQGIVHRDIKPENILLDRRGRVKVADFGLAKIVGSEAPLTPSLSPSDGERVTKSGEGTSILTDAGKVMGTPSYMAPEQAERPAEVDHRADIYALGVVFYQMLTGELPGQPLQPPSTKVQVDVRLDEVVLRALEKQPELRYQQASVLKTEVETIAGTPAPSERHVPEIRIPIRLWVKATLAVTGLTVLVGFLVWLASPKHPDSTLTGSVMDAVTGNPLTQATIALRRTDESGVRRQTKAGPDGGYRLRWPEDTDLLYWRNGVRHGVDLVFSASAPGHEPMSVFLSRMQPEGNGQRVYDFRLSPTNAAVASGDGSRPPEELMRVQFAEASFTDAIRGLAGQLRLNYVVDAGIIRELEQEPKVTVDWKGVTVRQALAALLESRNLELIPDPKTGVARVARKLAPGSPAGPVRQAQSEMVARPHPGAEEPAAGKTIPPSTTNTPPSASMTLRFGSEIVRVIQSGEAGTNLFLNLDTGELLTPPKHICALFNEPYGTRVSWGLGSDPRAGKMRDWLQASGAHLRVSDGMRGLERLEMSEGVAIPSPTVISNGVVVPFGFDQADPDYVATRIQPMLEPLPKQIALRIRQLQPGFDPRSNTRQDTFIFKTWAGSVGVLQILNPEDNPHGVRVRYKLVQRPATTLMRPPGYPQGQEVPPPPGYQQGQPVSLPPGYQQGQPVSLPPGYQGGHEVPLSPADKLVQDDFQFRWIADDDDSDSPVDVLPDGTQTAPRRTFRVLREVVLSGADVDSAGFTQYPSDSKELAVFLNPRGAEKFAEATADNIGRRLAIVWRGKVISAPVVRTKISGRQVSVTGNYTDAEAQQLLDVLNHRQPADPVPWATFHAAEGNVIMELTNARLTADQISFGVSNAVSASGSNLIYQEWGKSPR